MCSPHHERTHVKFSCLNLACTYRYPLYVLPILAERTYYCECCGWKLVSSIQQSLDELLTELGLTVSPHEDWRN
jgi:hypothetical protein